MTSFDLIVVGAGIVGAACADAAAASGLRVAVIEQAGIGGGATAAAMGHLVALDEDPAELALAHYSQQLWDEFVELPGAQFQRCGTLWVARDEREYELIGAKIARLQGAGITASTVDAAELHRLEPALAPGLAGGVRVPGDAVVYPPNVARKGHLVITERYVDFVRHQIVELGYADSAHGAQRSSVAFNVQPRSTGQVLIGSSREFDSATPEVSMPMVQRMLARAFDFLPGLRSMQALRIWTGFRPTSIDGKPYLGPVPDQRDLWVAAGHEGLGVTTALGSARLLVDQLLGRRCAIDPTPYLPARALLRVSA